MPDFKIVLIFFFFTTITSASASILTDTTKIERNSFSGFPVVYFTPETNWAFGGVGIYAFRLESEADYSRPSQLSIAAAYTLNKQVLVYLPFQIFWKEARRNFYGEIGYFRYNYFYYGIGNESRLEDEEIYDVNFPRVRLNALFQARPKNYLGFRYWFDVYEITNFLEGGLIDQNRPTGVDGKIISGIGPVYNYDSRDNIFTTRKGHFVEIATLFNRPALGSDFSFSKYSLDARKFISFNESTLALNVYAEFTTGDVPFYYLSFLGGSRRLRGYLEGRFRDKQYATLQAEYRFPLFWRLSGVVFAASGGVDENVGGIFDNLRYSAGGGIRFLLNPAEGINIRIDYGVGQNNESGFYLTIGEAF